MSAFVHVVPEFVETITIWPLKEAAAKTLPSADEATQIHEVMKGLFVIQVEPAFVEVHTMPPPPEIPATNLVPSADEATDLQYIPSAVGRLFDVHVTPEFVEMYNSGVTAPSLDIIASLLPSAEDVADCHLFEGALVCVHG